MLILGLSLMKILASKLGEPSGTRTRDHLIKSHMKALPDITFEAIL